MMPIFLDSGHGTQIPNLDGTEADGKDEGSKPRLPSSSISYSASVSLVILPEDVVFEDPFDWEGHVSGFIIDDVSLL